VAIKYEASSSGIMIVEILTLVKILKIHNSLIASLSKKKSADVQVDVGLVILGSAFGHSIMGAP
jgi:hypothetical protein